MRRASSKDSYKGKGRMSVAAADRAEADQIRIDAINAASVKQPPKNSIAKRTAKIGRGPGYTITETSYPRGASLGSFNTKEARPIFVGAKTGHTKKKK
jgi:hypothetical protein